jgi:hypothetical protein
MEPTSAPGLDTPKHPADGQQPAEGRAAAAATPTAESAHSDAGAPPSHWLSRALDTWLQNADNAPPGVSPSATH